MAETLGPGVLDDPLASDLSLEARLRAQESAWAGPGPARSGADQGIIDQDARLEALAAEVAAQRECLRDQEKALVGRIADVDDDRRLTTTQLQRGWQAQREQFEARVRSHARRSTLGLVLVLAGGGLLAYYVHLRSAPAALVGEVAALRQDVQRLAGIARQDAQLREQVAALSAAVGEISTRQHRSAKSQDQAPAAEGAALAERLERLTAAQKHQGAELESLQRGLQALVVAAQSKPGPSPDAPPAPPPGPGPHPPQSAAPAPETAPVPAVRPASGADVTPTATATTSPPPHITKMAITDRPFALQLLGSINRDRLLELAVRPDLPDPVYLREETRRGRPWFVLIHSLHATSAEAHAALAKLPASLRPRSPWIRDLPRGTDLDVVKRGAARH